MTSYLARLLEISSNIATIPRDWKISTVVHFYKASYLSALSNYRAISLNSVVCKQLEHVIAGYLRQVWDKNDWLYEGQHGFRPGYSRESHVMTVCQDLADCFDEGDGIDAIIMDFSKALNLVPLSYSLVAILDLKMTHRKDRNL